MIAFKKYWINPLHVCAVYHYSDNGRWVVDLTFTGGGQQSIAGTEDEIKKLVADIVAWHNARDPSPITER